MSAGTVLDLLAAWAELTPDKKCWTFLNDKGEITDQYTYKELDRITTSLASYLLNACDLKAGDRALLVFFPGLDFTITLLACFKAGVIAVPVFPPDPSKLAKDLHHFVSIQQSSESKVALTHSIYNFAKKISGIKNIFSSRGESWPDLKWKSVDDVIRASKSKSTGKSPSIPPAPPRSEIAFLQYTSGSTSEPKGVMITHGNLAHNEAMIIRELRADQNTVCVSWLPQYHDMGLIGSYLGLLYCGGTGYYISPISFLKDPMLWIRCLSKYNGTHTQAPNFAFALVTRKFKECPEQNLQLSQLQHMLNAAEPVDDIAIKEFYEIFAQFGLPRKVVVPTYGLAEHTVFVCSGGRQRIIVNKAALEENRVEVVSESTLDDFDYSPAQASQGYQTIVGCGYPKNGDNVQVIIVNIDTNEVLREDMVGEIWVTSLSKAAGYWNKPAVTTEEFHAQPSGGTYAADGFLRTGDLGFMHRDELFICGRSKDLIIVRGSNHYPQDIERTAEKADKRIREGCIAAFAVHNSQAHTESVVLGINT